MKDYLEHANLSPKNRAPKHGKIGIAVVLNSSDARAKLALEKEWVLLIGN